MSSMRIVLVDPLGDVLFSGESWLASGPSSPTASYGDNETEAEPDQDSESPETLRSGESGIFPVEHAKPSNANGANAAANDLDDERAA
jgi:hypothetical protein